MPNYYYPTNWVKPTGRVTRINANIDAIKLLKELEAAGRGATPEEQARLSLYNGWGGDKEVFNDVSYSCYQRGLNNSWYRSQEHDNWYRNYGKWYEQLKELLTKDEWEAAAASTLNAHYTSERVASMMWDAAISMGFNGGRVLEPAIGTGVFISTMPESLRGKVEVVGVELDSISARIAKHLFPEAEIHEMGFQEAPIRNNSIDLVITNVPFSDVGPGTQYGSEVRFNLHNYFINRSLDKLRPGGLSLVVTSASTMENNASQRAAIADRSELLGAVRLPRNAFMDNANTEVVTDVLALRKPDPRRSVPSQSWRSSVPVQLSEDEVHERAGGTPITQVEVNEYFVNNPAQVLGVHSLAGKMYGRGDDGQYTVRYPIGDDVPALDDAFRTALARLPSGVIGSRGEDIELELVQERPSIMGVKDGSLLIEDDTVYRARRSSPSSQEFERSSPIWREPKYKFPRGFNAEKAEAIAKDFVRLRDLLKAQIEMDLNESTSDEASALHRRELAEAYEGFVGVWGQINGVAERSIARLLDDDPEFGAVLALENVRVDEAERKLISKATILTERTLFPVRKVKSAETLPDALLCSLDMHGRLDTEYMAGLLGVEAEEVYNRLLGEGLAFEDPQSGELLQKEQYLTGDVHARLDAARLACQTDSRYLTNVEALEAVQPARIAFGELRAPLGATWIPPELLRKFAVDVLGQYNCNFSYHSKIRQWSMSGLFESSELRSNYGTGRISGKDIFEYALAGKQPKVVTEIEGQRVLDPKATSAAVERWEALRGAWDEWLKGNQEAQTIAEDAYNSRFNRSRLASYDGSHLTFPGLASGPGAMVPRPHQRNVVARILAEGCGLIAHNVGFGKTLEMILLAREAKRTGFAQKPMIVCDNPSYSQFVAEIRKCYPQLNLLCSTEKSMSATNRNAFLSRIATGNWDLIVVPQSHFDLIPNSPETELRFLSEEMDEIRETIQDAMTRSTERKLVRQLQKKLEKARERYVSIQTALRERQDDCLYYEQLGVDMLIVDEAHKYKRVPFATVHDDIKGIDTSRSQRALRMLMKVRHIQEKRDGRGIVLATATPVSNTMAEAWNMVRLCYPKRLKEYGVETFDEFFSTFCSTVNGLELNEANGKWRNVTRLSKFINGPTFIDFIRSAWDVQMDTSALNLPVPKLKGGEIGMNVVPLTAPVADLMDAISKTYEVFEKASNKRDLSFVPLVLMGVGMAASIDPRLVDASAPDDPFSLANTMTNKVVDIYNKTRADKGVQVIFCDRYRTMDTSSVDMLTSGGLTVAKEADIYDMDLESVVATSDDMDEDLESAELAEGEGESVAGFNLYEDIRDKLVARGMPREQIALITEAKTDKERTALFNRVNEGTIAVIIGSTSKLGTGVNIQKRLVAAHHVDPARDMTPAAMTQRNGRIVRQGNMFDEVEVIYYGMQDTAAPGIYDRISRKDKFIQQALSGKGVGVEFEDCGEVRLEEMKAALISDKRQLHRAELLEKIRDEKTKLETNADRRRHLMRSRDNAKWQIDMAQRGHEKDSAFVEDFCSRLHPLTDDAGAVSVVWPDGSVTEGAYSKVSRIIQERLDAYRKDSPDGVCQVLGEMVVNGLRCTLIKGELETGWRENSKRVGFHVEGCVAPTLRQSYKDRLGNRVETASLRVGFASAEGMLRVVEKIDADARGELTRLERQIANIQADMDKYVTALDAFEEYPMGTLQTLETELRELEADMAANPATRVRPVRNCFANPESNMVYVTNYGSEAATPPMVTPAIDVAAVDIAPEARVKGSRATARPSPASACQVVEPRVSTVPERVQTALNALSEFFMAYSERESRLRTHRAPEEASLVSVAAPVYAAPVPEERIVKEGVKAGSIRIRLASF